MVTASLFATPPERIIEHDGDINTPLCKLREKYLRKYHMTLNTFYAQAANNLSRLIDQ